MRLPSVRVIAFALGCAALAGASMLACGTTPRWQVAANMPTAALMAVHGTDSDDVWVVGAEDERGAVVLHFDGQNWTRPALELEADLWWVHALSHDHVLLAGSDASIVLFDGDGFERQETPGLGRDTVYGIWGASPDDVYAVGARSGRNGFIWHWDGATWTAIEQDVALPSDAGGDTPALFKVSGHGDDVWIVGDQGLVLRGNRSAGFERVDVDATHTDAEPADDVSQARLFTVHKSSEHALVVGGTRQGVLLEDDGGALRQRDALGQSERQLPVLQGAFLGDGEAWLAGRDGVIYRRATSEWQRVDLDLEYDVESLHAVWQDPSGGVWTVGGEVLSGSLGGGLALYRGPEIEVFEQRPSPASAPVRCPADEIDPASDASMARRWNEQLLGAIRRDLPRPTVHARNLYHASLASWDVWAAYEQGPRGVLVDEKVDGAQFTSDARDEAIAYASYRILSARYRDAVGGQVSQACFDALFDELGYDSSDLSVVGDTGRAVGNRVAAAVLEHFADDGSNAANDYTDPSGWTPDTVPLVVDEPGTKTERPLVWQQIVLAEAVTQNGIAEGAGVRDPVGTHWASVEPFALRRQSPEQPYFEPNSPPDEYDAALRRAIVQVIEKAAELDVSDGVRIDVSPASYGNNSLGADDGKGYEQNPVTGQPYESLEVLRGDFVRILAEFWADGPDSETPPGHWNTLANQVADHPLHARRLFGEGESLSKLAWDVHVYLALNGALHDAAIAAWELKRIYQSARPITLIRHFAALGQSSDPQLPSYHQDGLPLVPGLIEVVTKASSAPGERHEHLRRYQGELALWSWRGEPGDRERQFGGVGWIRGVEWIPYQRRTFVTPAFPGYVSGHSTFSRAAAEVLASMTGSPFFPGGLGRDAVEPGYLVFEAGPSEAVQLQWATYFDAADQAGQSRLWGGIHIAHDDYDGRLIGSEVGKLAVDEARDYF